MPRNRSTSFNVSTSSAQEDRKKQALDELQDIQYLVRRDWKNSLGAEANPLEVAIPLLDDTSVGLAHKLPEFQTLREKVSRGLRHAVNEHYDAFNNSVGSYSLLVQAIEDSQESTNQITQMLDSANKDFRHGLDLLTDLSDSSQRYNEMIEILEAIDDLQQIPERIDAAIGEKRFDGVFELIDGAKKTAIKYNLWSLSALQSTKQYLETQESNLFEFLIEELHSEIYLKNQDSVPFSKDIKFSNLEQYVYSASNLDISEKTESLHNRLEVFLEDLPKLQKKELSSADYEPGSFGYIYVLLETASKLNKLYQILEILAHRHSSELHQLIHNITKETRINHPGQIKAMDGLAKLDINSNDLILGVTDANTVILHDFFWNTFIKCLMVLQGHRFVYEVSKVLGESAESYGLSEIWSVIESELHQLISNYINESKINAPTGKATSRARGHSISAANAANINNGKSKNCVAGKNSLFHFAHVTQKDTTDNLQKVLRDIFPGVVASDIILDGSPYIQNEVYAQQETLVPSNIYNMRVILEGFLIFTEGSRGAIIRDLSERPSDFFNRFMRAQFLPGLEANLNELFNQKVESTSWLDVEQVDQGANNTANNGVEKSVVFESAVEFRNMFTSICSILNTTSSYRDEYTELVLGVLSRFSRKYATYHKELLPNEEVKQINKWMNSRVGEVSMTILEGDTRKENLSKEINLIVQEGVQLFNLNKSDLLDSDTLDQLCYIVSTISWLLTWLPNMRKIVSKEKTGEITIEKLKEQWTFLDNGSSKLVDNEELSYLSLTEEKVKEFDSVMIELTSILNNTLLSLRYDLRCKAIYYIGKSFKEDNWTPTSEPGDSDALVNLFNKELLYSDSRLSSVLENTNIIMSGLSDFIDRILVTGSEIIKTLNINGVKKIFLDILVLQQMLRNVMGSPEDVDFTRSLAYFDLLKVGEKGIIDSVKAGKAQFNLQENKNMIRLIFSEDISNPSGANGHVDSSVLNGRKKYTDALQLLSSTYAGNARA